MTTNAGRVTTTSIILKHLFMQKIRAHKKNREKCWKKNKLNENVEMLANRRMRNEKWEKGKEKWKEKIGDGKAKKKHFI